MKQADPTTHFSSASPVFSTFHVRRKLVDGWQRLHKTNEALAVDPPFRPAGVISLSAHMDVFIDYCHHQEPLGQLRQFVWPLDVHRTSRDETIGFTIKTALFNLHEVAHRRFLSSLDERGVATRRISQMPLPSRRRLLRLCPVLAAVVVIILAAHFIEIP